MAEEKQPGTMVEAIKQGIETIKDKGVELRKDYYKKTPVKWRKIGDTFQDVAIIAGSIVALFASPPVWVPVAILVLGRVGKILTNFTSE